MRRHVSTAIALICSVVTCNDSLLRCSGQIQLFAPSRFVPLLLPGRLTTRWYAAERLLLVHPEMWFDAIASRAHWCVLR